MEFIASPWVIPVVAWTVVEVIGKVMALLSKSDIWAINDVPFEDVDVPEWGGKVRVKGLTGRERDKFEADTLTKKGKGGTRDVNLENLRARLVIACVVDENFQPLFDKSDIMRLGEKSAIALERVFAKAQSLSGMSEDDVEELAGNSGSDQSEGSTSD